MKKLATIIISLAVACSMAAAKDYPVGISLSLYGVDLSPENAEAVKAAGVEWVEVVMTPFMRKKPENEFYTEMFKIKEIVDKAGLKVWSVHLPYGKNIDISVCDPATREKHLVKQERMIELAGIFNPQRLVLHPSAEPIPDSERAERLVCARSSIGRLSLAAKKIGAVLCIEDLPRTCLGRNSDEILYLIKDFPEVMVCFDVNHLLQESHEHFLNAVGNRIRTIHASDYDRIDERHWLEGMGVIDWLALNEGLKKAGYKGVFMHEVRNGDNINPATIKAAYRSVVCGKKK